MKVAILGAAGRMGRGIAQVCAAANDITVVGAFDRPRHPELGEAVVEGGPTLASSEALDLSDVDVLVDFSAPGAVLSAARAAANNKVAFLSGTTGINTTDRAAVESLSATIPVLLAPNTSLGVNVLLLLVEQATTLLQDWDAEVLELHHRHKADAPSGTALALAQAIADQRGVGDDAIRTTRSGKAPRLEHEIGAMALRGGDCVGEHTVFLFGESERIELTHRATDRRILIAGAVRAAHWLSSRPAGLYSMRDVLTT